ncbi:MAG: hypothetical protein RLZZ600_567 [Actinomycetota bacterium]|jgi:hypothetical protein
MKVGNFAKACTVVATAAMLTAGFVAAPAAMADPLATPAVTSQTLAGFGSDTTQDVMNEIAKTINAAKGSAWIASYDALGGTTVVAKPDGAAVPRANGSGEGFNLLQVAKGVLGSKAIVSGDTKTPITVTTAEAAGQVDFARSSGNGSSANASGMWAYVPFAKDAVTLAVNPASATNGMAALGNTLTLGASGDTATTASWYSIYHCLAQYVYTAANGSYVGVGATSTLPAGAAKATKIKPILPAFGSGTRKYFVGLLGYTDSATLVDPTSENTSCIVDTYAGQGINEHDGTAIKGIGAGAIGPFSIPQWVSQAKAATTGVRDRRNGAILLGAAATAPTTGTGAAVATNTAFPIKRIMYNVLPYGKLADAASNNGAGSREYQIFNGKNSLVCQATAAITKMGFIPLNLADAPASTEDCGYTGNRFGAATVAAPATISAEFSQVAAGESFDLTVEGNQEAGTADFANSADYTTSIGTAAIGAGEYRGTYRVDGSALTAGTTLSYKGKFTPTDTSVFSASAQTSTVATVKVVAPYTVAINDIPARVATGSKVAITATVAAAATNGGALVGGWLTVVDATSGVEYDSVYLPKRASVAVLNWTATAGVANLAVRYDPENSSAGLVVTSSAQDVTVAAAAATFASAATNLTLKSGFDGGTIAASNSTKVVTVTVKLTKVGALTPTGTVKVLISTGKSGGTALSITPAVIKADGTAVITLPKANKWRTSAGTRYLNVVYSGDSNFYSVTKSLKVSIS